MKTTKEQRKKLRHTYGGFSEEHNVFLDLLDDLDTQETELTKLRKRVEVLEKGLEEFAKEKDEGGAEGYYGSQAAFLLSESAKIAEGK